MLSEVHPHAWWKFQVQFVQDCIARRWTHQRAKQQLLGGASILGAAARATHHVDRHPDRAEVPLLAVLQDLEACFVGPLLLTPPPAANFPALRNRDSLGRPDGEPDAAPQSSRLSYRDALLSSGTQAPIRGPDPLWYRRYRHFTQRDHVEYLVDGRVRK